MGDDVVGDEAGMEKDLYVEDERENFCILSFNFSIRTLFPVAFEKATLSSFSCILS